MTSLPTVLFFTFPEYGQANVIIATSYELALSGVDVYISSFASLQPRVSRLQELITRQRDAAHSDDRPTGSVSFRECKGIPSFVEASTRGGLDIATFPHSRGVSGALKSYSTMDITSFPWTPEEHLVAIGNMKELIATIKPDIVVIDLFFYLAIDACQVAGQKFVIILPNSIKDVAATSQPGYAALWKYPVSSSGFPFPLKWWQIPLNIYLFLRLVMKMAMSARTKRIQALRRSIGVKPVLTYQFFPGVTHICPALPETDFPFEVIPEELVMCGPIILPFDSVEDRDPALGAWLDRGPTAMINLGSHFVCNEQLASEMVSAFRILLDYHDRMGTSNIQILWKVKPNGDIQKPIDAIIGKEVTEGRVKVVPWLEVEPVSIMQHPNMVCTVHHGGANSFFEGVWSGIPHIILPPWLDTYEYATRAEFLNIGIFGNKISSPGFCAKELGEALVRVTGDTEEARTFRSSAQRLKAICRAKGVGRKLAALAILKEAGITA